MLIGSLFISSLSFAAGSGHWLVTLQDGNSFQDIGMISELDFIARDEGSASEAKLTDELNLLLEGGNTASIILSFRHLRPWPFSDYGTRLFQHHYATEFKNGVESGNGNYQLIIPAHTVSSAGKASTDFVTIKDLDSGRVMKIDDLLNGPNSPFSIYPNT
jgi:hypothetical protein